MPLLTPDSTLAQTYNGTTSARIERVEEMQYVGGTWKVFAVKMSHHCA